MSYWKVAAVLLLGLGCGVAVILLMGKASNLLSTIAKPKTIYIVTLDAETDKAIPDADVSLNVLNTSVLNTAASNPPLHIKTLYTGATGGISLAPGTSFIVNIDAKGYENFSGQFKKNREDNEVLQCRLKKLPKTTLTVPNGFIGPLSRAFSSRQTINAPTKKEYEFHVNAKGEIEDDLFPDTNFLSKSLCDGVVLVRYEDGRIIPWVGTEGVTDSTIAIRPRNPLMSNGTYPDGTIPKYGQPYIVFVIGTAQDLKEANDKKPNAEEQEVKVQLDTASPTP
jgi:hypothetical protein